MLLIYKKYTRTIFRPLTYKIAVDVALVQADKSYSITLVSAVNLPDESCSITVEPAVKDGVNEFVAGNL